MAGDINFHIEGGEVSHPFSEQENDYMAWLRRVAQQEGKTIDNLSYIFCSDDFLLEINVKYLGHDYYTDIITFPYKEGTDLHSDMYISIDRVADNAQEYGESFLDELRRVMVHGLLHLMGYSDKSDEDIATMRAKEDEYIKAFK